jgi:xanthine dehydrogenase accessory factor
MYDVALSVLSCLRAGTEVHVAWVVAGGPGDGSEAVAITPGGGRMGGILEGAVDHQIVDAIPTLGERGGLVEVPVGPVEALVAGLPEGSSVTVAVVPGPSFPTSIWEALSDRVPVSFSLTVGDGRFTGFDVLEPRDAGIELSEGRLTCSLVPIPRVVIAGGGPIADALVDVFSAVGWRPAVHGEVGAATGAMATLADLDGVIVMGHDVETAGRALQGALASHAGYIGSIGSTRMQELRAEWLSYRGVEWSDRVHGPAGLAIGASTPGEIAVSIVAEAVAVLHGAGRDPGTSG